ncbi:MAG TPA: TIGR04255 family protein [Methylophilaceae bacterium]|jgi:uncharacterized protein (TIGR04255 family)
MNRNALGRLENAPLAYVLAQVRLLPVLDLDKHIPAIHSALRSTYPRYQAIPLPFIQIRNEHGGDVPQQPIRYEFASAENTEGLILHSTSIVFHVTAYTTYDAFQKQLEHILSIVSAQVPDIFVDRVGLRYIDYIVPEAPHTPEDYIFDELRCIPKLNLQATPDFGMTFSQYLMSEGALVVRYATGRGAPALPPDLIDMSLAPSSIMSLAGSDHDQTGVLDTDRFIEFTANNLKLDVNKLITYFGEMHEDLSKAFKSIVTDVALEIWNRK